MLTSLSCPPFPASADNEARFQRKIPGTPGILTLFSDFETGSVITRAKNMVPLLVPLFISAFRRAMDLAMAMEARCYRGGEGRTKMKPLIYKKRDRLAYIVLVLFLIICVVVGRMKF